MRRTASSSPTPTCPTASSAYADRPNVVVLRTLSKAWGMAGLRVGFLVAQPDVAAAVRKVVTPFSTSSVAQAAALAALRRADEMRRRADLVIAERTRVLAAVRQLRAGRSGQPGELRLAAVGRRARPRSPPLARPRA